MEFYILLRAVINFVLEKIRSGFIACDGGGLKQLMVIRGEVFKWKNNAMCYDSELALGYLSA